MSDFNYEIAVIAGEQYQIPETGLTEPEVKSLFEAIHPGVITATVNVTFNSDGVKVWTFTEKGGTKG
jgi:PRTRC genetic system protein C